MSARKPASKIFINYRRDDTRGEAGRLMDTLTDYMGAGRVFRDIEGIAGGANFEEVLHESVGSADALIVLIGPDWLNVTNSAGERRLDDPSDWVAKEIIAAMERGLPVYPVLVEDAQMPHADELPDGLKPLARYNAVSLSDKRWHFDATRLAKIIAFDLPGSVTERTLNWVRLLAVVPLFMTMAFTTALLVRNAWLEACKSLDVMPVFYKFAKPVPDIYACPMPDIYTCHIQEALVSGYKPPFLLELWQSGVSFVVIVAVSVLLLVFASMVDGSRRIYFYASGLAGLSGTLLCFILLAWVDNAQEPIMGFLGSTVIASLMFVFMCLSGFKAK